MGVTVSQRERKSDVGRVSVTYGVTTVVKLASACEFPAQTLTVYLNRARYLEMLETSLYLGDTERETIPRLLG